MKLANFRHAETAPQGLAPSFQRLIVAPTGIGLASRLALARIKKRAIDPLPLLRRSNITEAMLEARNRVNITSQIDFLNEASRALNDEWLGLTLARELDLREIGMIYYVAASSDLFGDALRRIARYGRVVSEALDLRADRRDATLHIAISYSGFSRHSDRHQAEFFAMVLLRLCRKMIGRRIVPIATTFVHHRPENSTEIHQLFGGDVQFSSRTDGLTFDATLLDVPVIDRDPYLNDLMVRLCDEAVATRVSNVSPFHTLVENTIAPLLPHGEAHCQQCRPSNWRQRTDFCASPRPRGSKFWRNIGQPQTRAGAGLPSARTAGIVDNLDARISSKQLVYPRVPSMDRKDPVRTPPCPKTAIGETVDESRTENSGSAPAHSDGGSGSNNNSGGDGNQCGGNCGNGVGNGTGNEGGGNGPESNSGNANHNSGNGNGNNAKQK